MKLSPKITKKIIEYFAKKPEAAAVYLYGSYSRGDAKKTSDIDLAVLVTDARKYKGFGIPQVIFSLDLEKITGKKIEVQDLKSCRVDFAHRVLSTGILVYEGNVQERIKFEEDVFRLYFDLKPFFDEYYKCLSEIAKRGELHVRYL